MEPYKLKVEIREFILQKAKERPELGCRKLAGLIQENFQADISKSTISSLLKSSGLNKAIGRRRTHKNDESCHCEESAYGGRRSNPALEIACLPARQASLPLVAHNDSETLQETKQLPFQPQETQECGEWFLKAAELCLGGMPTVEDTNNPENTNPVTPQLFSELVSRSTEALALKFILEDNSFFFLDAGCHTIWSAERIPERLSVGLHKARNYLNERVISNRQPLILQVAPGFDTPAPALFDFIDAFQAERPERAVRIIELYSADNLLIDTIELGQRQEKRYFIIGLWPWQYKNRDFALPMRLLPINDACNRKKLDIITNFESDKKSDDEIIGHYLTHWPNLESGYQDFLDEIGHFIRSPKTQARDKCPFIPNNGEALTYGQLLSFWRLILNSYCQRHFLPSGYQELDFLVLQERFYHLRGTINSPAGGFAVKFHPPEDFSYLKDLQYACQRVSEADIRLEDGCKLRFEIK